MSEPSGIGLASPAVKRLLFDPLRTAVTLLVMAPITLLAAGSAIVVSWVNPRSRLLRAVTTGWSRPWLVLTGTTLEVRGGVDDVSASYVIISNHSSWLDIMANFIAVPVPVRFLAKKELFRVPFMGAAMRAMGMVEIDRERAVSMHDAINEGVRKVASKGDSVMVYPEGTRTRDGAIRPFKRGAFFMAIDNQLPLLPVTISGSYDAWPPGLIARGGRIIVEIGEPIPVDGLGRDDLEELKARSERLIHETRERLDDELALG